LKARRASIAAPPVSGIAAVPSAYESETSMNSAPTPSSTHGVSPSAKRATMPSAK
jgi:hypothetical protein